MKVKNLLGLVFVLTLLSSLNVCVFASEAIVSTQSELAAALSDNEVTTITLGSDIIFSGDWTPAYIGTGRTLLIDGAEYTISNMEVHDTLIAPRDGAAVSGGGSCYGHAGFIGSNYGNVTIKKLTFSNATVDADNHLPDLTNHGSTSLAVVSGYIAESASLICEDVHIENSTVTGYTKVGGFTGQDFGTLKLKDCSITNSDFTLVSYTTDTGTNLDAAFMGAISGYKKGTLEINGVSLDGNDCVVSTVANYSTLDVDGKTTYWLTDGDWNLAFAEICYMAGYTGDTIIVDEKEQNEYGAEVVVEAEIDGSLYSTLELAVAAAAEGDVITLLNDVALAESLEISGGKDITIDLNNHTISAPSTTLFVKNAKLKVTGTGTIKETAPYYGAIMVSGSDNEADTEYTKLYVDKNVKLVGWSPIFIRETDLDNGYGIVIDVYGTLEGVKDTSNGDGFGIYINGCISKPENCPIVNIYEGAKVSGTEIGIFAGGYAIWNITGATIKGQTAIYQKTGELNISDGIFEANGEQKDYVYNANGANATGDAIVIDYCKYPGGEPIVSITNGEFKSANNQAVASYVGNTVEESARKVNFVSGGYYSLISEDLVALDKMLTDSDKEGYAFMIVDIERDVSTKADVQEPNVEVPADVLPEGITISGDSFEAQESVLQNAGSTLVEDGTVSEEEAMEALQQQFSGDRITEATIVILPYIDIEITGFESGDTKKSITLEIEAKYDVIATTASGDQAIVTESGDSQNAVVVKEAQPLAVEEEITITIGLPEGFAEPNSTLYVHHIKENVTYVYEATVDGEGKTATFVNPHGFSEFVVTTENGAVKNSTTGTVYETLADAMSEIANGQTLVLLKDNAENVTVSKEITIKLDKAGYTFSGSITASNEYDCSISTSGNVVTYTFTKKTQDNGNGSNTGSTGGSGGGSGTTRYVIRFETNGGTEIEKVKVEKNKKLEKPANPTKEGYIFEGWFVDKSCTEGYDFDAKVKNGFTLYAKWNEVKEEETWKNPFADVKEDDWYYEAVKFANENKLFNGVSSTEFGANVSMTRAMLVTVLYRLEGEPATNRSIPFADVDMSMYYANAVIWAKQNNIVNGVDETNFAPNAKVTREQLVTILYRYAEYKGKDLSVGENTNILSYDDYNELSEYAIPAMQWACGSGIITGRTISTIAPKGTATRAEVATMLMRFTK